MKNKKNFLFALIGAGTLVLSAGVGFAAWTINAKNTEIGSGDITVSADGMVIDNRIAIDTKNSKFKDGFSTVSFVADTTKKKASDWLTVTGESKEQLTLKYDVVVTGGKGLKVQISEAKVVDEGTQKTFTNLTGADNKKIFGALPSISQVIDMTEQTTKATKGTYIGTIELTFTWGEAFENENPYKYYNANGYDKSSADQAKTNIEKLQDIKDYQGLKLSYKVSVA